MKYDVFFVLFLALASGMNFVMAFVDKVRDEKTNWFMIFSTVFTFSEAMYLAIQIYKVGE